MRKRSIVDGKRTPNHPRHPSLALLAAVVIATGCDSGPNRPLYESPAYRPSTGDVPNQYAEPTASYDSAREDQSDELREAKSEFEDAAGELRSSVSALSYTEWQDQMPNIQSRLDDAEEALERLEAVTPHDSSVQSARDEIDRMRSHMSRLHSENWRQVAPDMDSTSSSIEDEASSVSDELEEE